MSSSNSRRNGFFTILRAILYLIFSAKRFDDLVVADFDEMSVEARRRDKARQAQPAPSKEASQRQQASSVRVQIRRQLLGSAGWVAVVIIVGKAISVGLESTFGPASPRTLVSLQYWGIGLLLWATLGKGGWSIQTMRGDTIYEDVDDWIFRGLYLGGSLPLVISATWAAQ